VRIRFAETDAQGIAHHASFVVWLEVARVAYLARHSGGYQAIRDSGLEALTTEVCLRYHRAAYFDETLTIWSRCVDVR
jgi:acyl-CoA thioester hydrolase